MKNVRNGRMGDLYVKVVLEIPTKLNSKQKKAVEEMGKALITTAIRKVRFCGKNERFV